MNTRLLLELFLRFLKIGLVGFGGGWAILPIIQREIVEDAGWLSEDEYMDIVAIAGSTPGPVAVNAATYVGFKLAGPIGAAVATLAVVLPPFTIISIIAYTLTQYIANKLIQALLKGLKAAVLGLIIIVLYTTAKQVFTKTTGLVETTITLTITIYVVIAIEAFKIHPIIALLSAATIGIILGALHIW